MGRTLALGFSLSEILDLMVHRVDPGTTCDFAGYSTVLWRRIAT